ncbi:unnamed protein product [Lampetra planeri]
MTLATVFCLRNLRKTMCYQGFRNKLCLRSDVFLPSEICDKLVNAYVPAHIFYRKGGAPLACNEDTEDDEEERPISRQALDTDFNFHGFNRLRLLNLGGLPAEVDAETLLKPLRSLTSLDLSNVHLLGTAFLAQWKDRLASLVLYNVDLSEELVSTLVELLHLRRNFQFKMTRKILTAVVQRLSHLVSLDISGHVLLDNCTVPHFEEAMGRPSTEPCKSSIYPLQELKRPLQFLGLYDTTLCNVTHIPAYKVTGSKNEEQVLNAIEAYTEHRPELAHKAINQLFDIARIQTCSQLLRGAAARHLGVEVPPVIEVVLNGMEQYQEVTVSQQHLPSSSLLMVVQVE